MPAITSETVLTIAVRISFTILRMLVAIPVFTRLYLYFATQRWKSTQDLTGRVVVINVEGSGIGVRAAQDLSTLGATVILGTPRVTEFARILKGNTRVDVRELDLYDLDSVRSFARRILEEQTRLDILINNFGRAGGPSCITIDGFDEIHQSISLGPFLLTDTLLPLMRKSVPSRIINVGFFNHGFGSMDVANYENQVKGLCTGSSNVVCDATLALVMWSRSLSKELRNSGVTINLSHPGLAYSLRESCKSVVGHWSSRWVELFCGSNATVGDYNLLYLCTDPVGQIKSGSFFSNCLHQLPLNDVDREASDQLVLETRRLLYRARDWS